LRRRHPEAAGREYRGRGCPGVERAGDPAPPADQGGSENFGTAGNRRGESATRREVARSPALLGQTQGAPVEYDSDAADLTRQELASSLCVFCVPLCPCGCLGKKTTETQRHRENTEPRAM